MKHFISYHQINSSSVERLQSTYNTHKKQLESFAEQLLWWNTKINLLSRDVSRETILDHIQHSLCVTLSAGYENSPNIIDTGTGGGLPGIPLAILSPEKSFILNDIVGKKITAVKQISRSLSLQNVTGSVGSIEKLEIVPPQTIISKHAFKIPTLIAMVDKKPWENLILLKGYEDINTELSKTEIALDVKIWELNSLTPKKFYEGKGLVEITRK